MIFVDVLLTVARRTWMQTVRRPVVLSFSFVQPLLWMAFFGFLFERYGLSAVVEEKGEAAAGLTYLDFLAPGVCAMTVLFGASQSGIGWIRDLQTGFLARLLRTPSGALPLLLGKVFADVMRLLVQAVLVLGLAMALGVRPDVSIPGLVVGLLCLLLFATAFASLSCAIALRTRAQEAMAVFVHVVNMPVLFTSTALVPGKQMPDWLAAVSRYNPLTITVDAFRNAVLFREVPDIVSSCAPLLALAVVLFGAAFLAMRGAGRD